MTANAKLLFWWGLLASLAMLYFLARWFVEPAQGDHRALTIGFVLASLAAVPPCLRLAVLVWRQRAVLSRSRAQVLLLPGVIAATLLLVRGLVALEQL